MIGQADTKDRNTAAGRTDRHLFVLEYLTQIMGTVHPGKA